MERGFLTFQTIMRGEKGETKGGGKKRKIKREKEKYPRATDLR